MAYIILALIGILAVMLVKSEWNSGKQLAFISLILLVGTASYIIIDLTFLQKGDVITKGHASLDRISWLEISLYFVTIIGMMAKYFFDAIGEGNKIKFKKWQFIKPILVSPIVFATVYIKTGDDTSVILLIIFAFQNGFFWQTILNSKLSANKNG